MSLDWEAVQKVVADARNRGAMMSNFFQSEGSFDVEVVGETTFLFKQEAGFWHLYFFTKSAEDLSHDLELLNGEAGQRIVVDVLGPDRIREPLENAFKSANWEVLTVLQRMGRKTPEAMSECLNSESLNGVVVEKATIADVPQVQAWFGEFFDAEQEQLPDDRQVGEWLEKGTLMVARNGGVRSHRPIGVGAMSGFVAFDLSPAQLYLRYWFVHPSARGTGVGGALMRAMFAAGANTKRQYFWVKTDNENAIKRYQHYGFQFESMKNTVLRLPAAAIK